MSPKSLGLPGAFLYTGFLSDEECVHLISLAKDRLQKSMVGDENGKSVESQERTSSGMFLQMAQDEVVSSVEAKIAAWTFLPQENGERMQILHYELGQEYVPHYDYFDDEVTLQLGGHRIATVLMYLSNVKKGGETVFPRSEEKYRQPKSNDWSDCAKQGYAVKPRKGDALLFFNLHLNATIDPSSLHGSCPVIDGEKWSATKWLHVRDFDESRTISGCFDLDLNCATWAEQGECDINPLYMVGSNQSLGHCRKSCKVCSS
ncbi:putative prolyl 4-hydroxylase 7 [Castilleja foliolosa]|uniref:procollagen-proline 4-dioxygenase n=1 Tax=Castilleja foliolosa TaxID=1961234 RepID=A0ABD3DNQ0_9LAMI